MEKRLTVKDIVTITVAMFFMSVAIYYLMIPNDLVFGSLAGLVLILSKILPISFSTLSFVLNVVLFIIGYIVIGREFGVKTLIASLLFPAFIRVFEIVSPTPTSPSGNLVIDIVAFMIVISIGQGLLFNMNASSGGIDIVVKILNKYLGLKMGTGLTVAGFTIAAMSILVYDKQTTIISLLGTYIYGIVLDSFCDGFRVRKRVCIISKNYQEIQDYIVNELRRGATLYHAYGSVTGDQHMEIQTILEKNEYMKLISKVNQIDPNAFMTVSMVNEVVGLWNTKKRTRLGF